jgi:repressor LexA
MQLETVELMTQLTPRQLELLRVINFFQLSRCYSPTIAEMGTELNISRSTVFGHIGELRKKGLILTCRGKARSLKLTSKAQELLSRLGDGSLDSYQKVDGKIPLVGRIAAGVPIEAIENRERISLESCFSPGDEIFALEVAGDSMVDDDIRDGDYVICRRSSVADDGQLVVAIVDREDATLKRFYKEKGCVRLQPANESYQPIYSDDCRIDAVVVGLVRKL